MRQRRARVAAIGAVAVLALLCGCASTPAPAATATSETGDFPFTVDDCGTSVTFTAPPHKVLAIKSTSIEMMLALGVSGRIAGVAFPDGPYATAWAPAADPPVISDRVPSMETVLDLEPDLVYAGWESNVTSDGAGDRDALAAVGINTLVSPAACQEAGYQPNPLTWGDIWDEITLMGRVFDVDEAARQLVAQQRARLEDVTADARGLSALWYSSGRDTPYVGAGIGSPELVLETIGLRNIAAGIAMTWSPLSWESVVDADPDVIVLVDSTWNTAASKIAQLEGNPATASLTAVRTGRYLTVPFPAGEAGVRTVEAAETLSAQLAALDLTDEAP